MRVYDRTNAVELAVAASQYFDDDLERAYLHANLLCRHLCFHAARELRLFDLQVFTLHELQKRIGAAAQAHYFLSTIMELLQEDGFLVYDGQKFTVPRSCPPDESDRLQREARLCCPGAAPIFDLVESCRQHAAAFVTGVEPGINAIFPRGDLSVWERVHEHDRIMSVYADLIPPALENMSLHKQGRLLELGAGVGGVLRRCLPLLREIQPAEYWFTDIGKLFVQRAQQVYGKEAFIRFQTVDIDLAFQQQKLEQRSFDIVFGVNVLHLAKNLEFTLRQVFSVTKDNGVLILAEGSPPARGKRWPLDLVFAFLKGWWDVPVDALRPRPGFLFPGEWAHALSVCGFREIELIPGEHWFEGACRGGLVLARKCSSAQECKGRYE